MKTKGLRYAEWNLGEVYETAARTVTETDIVQFAGLSGDYNPLHTDEVYARQTVHGGRIAHGALTFAITTGLVNQSGMMDGTVVAFMEVRIQWTAAVKPGDTLRATMVPQEKHLTQKGDRGIVTLLVEVQNQEMTVVSRQEWKLLVLN